MTDPALRKHEHHFPGFQPALFGYLVSGLIFTVMLYGLLLEMRQDNIEGCEARNATRVELNQRGVAIDRMLTLLAEARVGPDVVERSDGDQANRREAAELLRLRDQVDQVPLVDCEDQYGRPWPLSVFD